MAKIHWLHTAIGRVYRIALRCTHPFGGAQRLQQYPQSIRQFERAQLKRSAVRDKGPDSVIRVHVQWRYAPSLRASADRARLGAAPMLG
jgi:hypothetical protein